MINNNVYIVKIIENQIKYGKTAAYGVEIDPKTILLHCKCKTTTFLEKYCNQNQGTPDLKKSKFFLFIKNKGICSLSYCIGFFFYQLYPIKHDITKSLSLKACWS